MLHSVHTTTKGDQEPIHYIHIHNLSVYPLTITGSIQNHFTYENIGFLLKRGTQKASKGSYGLQTKTHTGSHQYIDPH